MSEPRVISAEILEEYAQRCNALPSLALFGVKVSFPNSALVRLLVDSVPLSMRGGLGDDAIVNGGVLSGLCDLLIGCTCGLVDPASRSATVQLSIRFERPLRGPRIVGEARVDRATGRLVFASAEIGDGSATASVRCQGIATLLGSRAGEGTSL